MRISDWSSDVCSSDLSQFIARNLGIGDPAKAQMCLGCHSTAGTARAVPAEDGVGCESCHGPAGGRLASPYAGVGPHADPDREMRDTQAVHLSGWLTKLTGPGWRAGGCADGHFGSA